METDVRKKILEAKEFLESQGYSAMFLWHTDDVCNNYDVDQDEALNILEDALEQGEITSQIFEAIDIIAEVNGHKPKNE